MASEKNLTTIWTFRSVKSSENDRQSYKEWHEKKKGRLEIWMDEKYRQRTAICDTGVKILST